MRLKIVTDESCKISRKAEPKKSFPGSQQQTETTNPPPEESKQKDYHTINPSVTCSILRCPVPAGCGFCSWKLCDGVETKIQELPIPRFRLFLAPSPILRSYHLLLMGGGARSHLRFSHQSPHIYCCKIYLHDAFLFLFFICEAVDYFSACRLN